MKSTKTKTKPLSAKQYDLVLKRQRVRIIRAIEWNKRLSVSEYTYRRLTFGKYSNWMIKDLPDDYIKWGILNLDDYWADFFRRELQKRQPKWR